MSFSNNLPVRLFREPDKIITSLEIESSSLISQWGSFKSLFSKNDFEDSLIIDL